MSRKSKRWLSLLLASALLLLLAILWAPITTAPERVPTVMGNVETGRVLLNVAGCYACHTDTAAEGLAFAGGAAIESPFGNFYAPNITSSTTHGIGSWSLAEFERALRKGISPEGMPYYPAFPYISYRNLTDQDVADLYAAAMAIEPVNRDSQAHDVGFPFNVRLGLKPWRWLFAPMTPANIDQSTVEGRGRYLVDAVAHCGECHNPRNALGAFIPPYLGGNDQIPGGVWAPPIHARALENVGWSEDDIYFMLDDGMMPDGDYVGGSMAKVVDYGTRYLSESDRSAIAQYLFSLRR